MLQPPQPRRVPLFNIPDAPDLLPSIRFGLQPFASSRNKNEEVVLLSFPPT